MNLSLVSQQPSATASQELLTILRSSAEYGEYFSGVSVTPLTQWQPTKEEAAILLIDEQSDWSAVKCVTRQGEMIGLPVLPLLMRKGDDSFTLHGPDVRDPRFYFVSNGIVLEESELSDPACSQVLLSKLESYFPLLSRLILLRQRQPAGLLN